MKRKIGHVKNLYKCHYKDGWVSYRGKSYKAGVPGHEEIEIELWEETGDWRMVKRYFHFVKQIILTPEIVTPIMPQKKKVYVSKKTVEKMTATVGDEVKNLTEKLKTMVEVKKPAEKFKTMVDDKNKKKKTEEDKL